MDTTQRIGVELMPFKDVEIGWWFCPIGSTDYNELKAKTGSEAISPDTQVEVWD